MKKLVFIMICIYSLQCNQLFSQDNAYNKGDILINAGVSFGSYNHGYLGNKTGGIFPITLSLEKGFFDKISIGGYAGYTKRVYDYSYILGSYEYSWTYFSIGARGSYHYLSFINEALDMNINEEKWDFYISVILGLEFRNYKSDFTATVPGLDYNDSETKLALGPFAGWKYMFSDNFDVFLEGGRHVFGWGTIGLTLKF